MGNTTRACVVVYDDETPCPYPRSYANGWCKPCYAWSHKWKQSANGRPNPKAHKPAPPIRACTVTYADGTACSKIATQRRRTICDACYDWSRSHGGADPNGRHVPKRIVRESCTVVYADGTPCANPPRRKTSEWCDACYIFFLSHGRTDPNGRDRFTGYRRGEFTAFLEAAARATTNECIIPIGGFRPYKVGDKQMPASRAVWIMAHDDPGDLHVRHTCNGGSGAHGCVNIQHLTLGTHDENMQDMVDGGHSQKGERHHGHILTVDDVHEIRRMRANGVMQKDVAARFGVSRSTISDIEHGRTWGWLPHDDPEQGDERSSRGTSL